MSVDSEIYNPSSAPRAPRDYGDRSSTYQQGRSQPKLQGHDSVLRAIQNQGRTIFVQLISGDLRTGTLVGRDKYTITVKTAEGIRRVIYKHAIEEFYTEELHATEG